MGKVYIEELEELSLPGTTLYSLVHEMDFFDADVRASGVTIIRKDGGEILDEELLSTLHEAMHDYLLKTTGSEYALGAHESPSERL